MAEAFMIADEVNQNMQQFSLNHSSTPERNLLVAMVQRALLDYFGTCFLEKKNATEWLFAEQEPTETENQVFSFSWICDQLDLEQEQVLSQISKMKPTDEAAAHKWGGMRRIG
ncbi:MAG: hypothetical protein IT291_01575 [Deltaproteobacteria bacterium]|nr:hypothetical protein [Deltaproteobacteria bacterium]